MEKILIKVIGWIGDSFFTLAACQALKKERNCTIDLLLQVPQPLRLLNESYFVDRVYFLKGVDEKNYDVVYTMPVIEDKSVAPTIQFQKACNVQNTFSEFSVRAIPQFDSVVSLLLDILKKDKKIITYQADWEDRKWSISDEERRFKKLNTKDIVPHFKTTRPGSMSFLYDLKSKSDCIFIPISPYFSSIAGLDCRGYSNDPDRYALLASIINQSDLFLGAEGGLANLAAGLNTRCIITTCHMHMMFGSNGVMSQCDDIQLGPEKLFPNAGHINLSPFLSNGEIYTAISNEIDGLFL